MSRPASPTFRCCALALGLLASAVTALSSQGCARHRAMAAAGAPPPTPTASPGLRGQSSGLELWVWVVSDPRPLPPEPETSPDPDPVDVGTDKAPSTAAKDAEKPAPGTIKRVKPAKPPPIRYIVKDGRASLEQALRPYLDREVPGPYEARARWRASGLRLVSIPPEDLPLLESAVRMVGPVQRQWLGEVPEWTDLIRSTPFEDGPVTGPESVVRLDAGRIRLLARSWSVPADSEGGSGGLRLELVPQHQPRQNDAQKFASALEPPKPIEDQGVNFAHLAMGMTITGTDALAIVCDSPGANWNEDPPPGAGPDPLALFVPTIGERMLSMPPTATSPRTRAVLILVPHVRAKYSVLP